VMWGLIFLFFITGRDCLESFGYVKELKDIEAYIAILITFIGFLIWCGLFTIALAMTKFYDFIKTVLFGK
jgi:hypothetical protein